MTTTASEPTLLFRTQTLIHVLGGKAYLWIPGRRNTRGHVSCIQGCCDMCCPEPWYSDIMEGDALDNEIMVSFLGDRLDRDILMYGYPHNPRDRRRGPGAVNLPAEFCRICDRTSAVGFGCPVHG